MRNKTRVPAAIAALFFSGSCGSSGESFQFSSKFLFGTAIAGFQVDMGCPTLAASACEDPNSDWYQFVTSPVITGNTAARVKGDHPNLGPGHWELYELDYDLASRDLKNNAMRFSIEWSRVFPRATDAANDFDALRALASADALAHYHAELAAMKARGLTPFVTLNHYTLPVWIHDTIGCHRNLTTCSPRGWVDAERTIREIAKFAGFCAKEFGAEVDLWATQNESFTSIAIAGYLFQTEIRSNPPAVSLRIEEAKTVYRALIEAHARMYDAVKAGDTVDADGDGVKALVGLVYPMVPFYPKNPQNPLDVQAAADTFYLWNMAFLNGVAAGKFDANIDRNAVLRDDLKGRMDFLGINYYGAAKVEGLSGPAFPQLSPLTTFNPLTFESGINDPKGIYDMIHLVKKEFRLPVFISENGIMDPNDDGTAPEFLVRHLQWVWRAIADGADVRGYFYWTLIDNYEWHLGVDFRMGLFAVDNRNPQKPRTARKAAGIYGRIAAEKKIPSDLLKSYPEKR